MFKGNFRTLPTQFNPACQIRENNLSPLILIHENGECCYGNTPIEKDEIVKNYKEGSLLLYAWTGKYKTDVFIVTADNLKVYYVCPHLENTMNSQNVEF